MITLFLMGGLGNQMFQYAFARALQLKTGKKLCFSASAFKNDEANRTYALGTLKLNKEAKLLSHSKGSVRYFIYRLYNKIITLIKGKNEAIYTDKYIINGNCDDGYQYKDCYTEKFAKNLLVCGFFQNYKFFNDYKDIIQNELKVNTEPSYENSQILEKISRTNSVCVHIRRGDYLDKKWAHLNVCTTEYYKEAMKNMKAELENPVFYIFSNTKDDIEWIKQTYDFSEYQVIFVDLDNPDYEELRLMYSCKHFIISNSTFSWWAQYLGEYGGKVVFAPSEWNRLIDDCSGIYMPEWRIIRI